MRFDPVYVGRFKYNLRRIMHDPNLHDYVCPLYQMPGVAATVNIDHIKRHYDQSHHTISPTRVVPLGPQLDLQRPHRRADLTGGTQAERVAIGT